MGKLEIITMFIGFIGLLPKGQQDISFLNTEEEKPIAKFKNEAFKRGEKLSYRIHYGIIDAGLIKVEVKDEVRKIGGRNVYHMVGTGVSKGTFDWFFKVRDTYETYLDEEAIVPWIFVRRVYEGGFIINEDYLFNHFKKKVSCGEGKVFDVPDQVQDMFSAFYFARCIDFSNAKEGDIFKVNSFVDKENFPLEIKYAGKETIKTDFGRIRCIKFRPVLQKGRVFKSEEDLNVWVTDDKNRIPVRAEAKVLVGSLKVDLQSYSGLLNPISIVKK